MNRQRAQTIMFASALGLIALLEIVIPSVLERALYPLTTMTASAASLAFGLFDVDVARSEFVFAHSGGFAYEIYYRCTGFWPVLLLAGLITADGAVLGRRRAILIGGGLLLLLNLVRLLSLFWVGVEFPRYFWLAHSALWPLAMMGTVLSLWLASRRRGTDKLTKSATGPWECHASFDLKTRSEWALASTYRALQTPSSSASPRLRINLSVPSNCCQSLR